jgi:hypothetical protein
MSILRGALHSRPQTSSHISLFSHLFLTYFTLAYLILPQFNLTISAPTPSDRIDFAATRISVYISGDTFPDINGYIFSKLPMISSVIYTESYFTIFSSISLVVYSESYLSHGYLITVSVSSTDSVVVAVSSSAKAAGVKDITGEGSSPMTDRFRVFNFIPII